VGLIIDFFHTIASSVEAEYKEKNSKFLAFAFPIQSVNQLEEILTTVKSIHPKARHYCYAYRLGITDDNYRMNDDGEPSGTAGKPIYGQLLSFGITDTIVVVVRYFGGTKLGASGLITAYKEATKMALSEAEIIEKFISNLVILNFGYDQMGQILNDIKELDIEIIDKVFELDCIVVLSIRKSLLHDKLTLLKAKLLNKSIEEIHEDTIIDFCEIEIVED